MSEDLSRLQSKCARQSTALTLLQRRVENQRAELRVINELGRGLTKEEFVAAVGEKTDHTGAPLELVEA